MGYVDVGCHYIARREYTFRLLTEVLGIPCDRQRHDMLWHIGSPSKGERAAPTVMARARHCLMKWLLAGRLVHTDVWYLIRDVAMFRLRKWPSAFTNLFLQGSRLYPRGGAHAVVSGILAQIEESSVHVITEVVADRVVVGEEDVPAVVHTDKGAFLATGVVTGQYVAFDVQCAGKSVIRQRQHTTYVHTVLRVKGNKQRPFDFIDIFKSRVTSLKRVQDVTPYATKQSNPTTANLAESSRFRRVWREIMRVPWGQSRQGLQQDDLLICCEHTTECSSGSEHAEELLKHLKQLRLLTGDTRLVA